MDVKKVSDLTFAEQCLTENTLSLGHWCIDGTQYTLWDVPTLNLILGVPFDPVSKPIQFSLEYLKQELKDSPSIAPLLLHIAMQAKPNKTTLSSVL